MERMLSFAFYKKIGNKRGENGTRQHRVCPRAHSFGARVNGKQLSLFVDLHLD